MLEIITALVAAQLHIAQLDARVAELESTPPVIEQVETVRTEYVTEYIPTIEYVTVPAETRECGTCGAHVTEWWQVRNDADTAFVDVCERCCERIEREGEHDDLD